MTSQPFAFCVHFEGPPLQCRKSCSDLFQVEIGCDARVTSAFDHCAELSVLELLEGPLQRIVGDGQVPIGPVVLVARAVMVMGVLPEAIERKKLGFLDVCFSS